MNWYKKATSEYDEMYHGTDSPPFDEFDPSKAQKGEPHYNPLGDAMYVTDKPDFAKMFGENVYPVRLPKDMKLKKIKPSQAESAIRDIANRALKRVGIDYWDGTDLNFKVQYGKLLEQAQHSPYDAIIETVNFVGMLFPEKADDYGKAVSEIATQKFSKFDAVTFVGTHDPNNIFIGESPTKEILIFNKAFQKVFQQ